MKSILSALVLIASYNLHASTIYDDQITICKKENIELTIKGKSSFFDSRNITVKSSGKVIINEKYKELYFPYDEHSAQYSRLVPKEFEKIQFAVYKAKPGSITRAMDFYFRSSANTIVYESYDALQEVAGGESPAIFLQFYPTSTILIFDVNTQCKISSL